MLIELLFVELGTVFISIKAISVLLHLSEFFLNQMQFSDDLQFDESIRIRLSIELKNFSET